MQRLTAKLANDKCPGCGAEGGGFSGDAHPLQFLWNRNNRPHRRRGRARSPKSVRNEHRAWFCRRCHGRYARPSRGAIVEVELGDIRDESAYDTIRLRHH